MTPELQQFQEVAKETLFDLFLDIQTKQSKSQPLADEYVKDAMPALTQAAEALVAAADKKHEQDLQSIKRKIKSGQYSNSGIIADIDSRLALYTEDGGWEKFTDGYEKAFYEVKLPDGTIVQNCWPNAGKIRANGKSYTPEDDILVRKQLNIDPPKPCETHGMYGQCPEHAPIILQRVCGYCGLGSSDNSITALRPHVAVVHPGKPFKWGFSHKEGKDE